MTRLLIQLSLLTAIICVLAYSGYHPEPISVEAYTSVPLLFAWLHGFSGYFFGVSDALKYR